MAKEVCILYANCIPVKGAFKSIICDLQRQNYIYIPNDLYNIITTHRGKRIQEVKDFYENKYDDIIDNYFQILLKNEFAFLTDTPDLFPKMNMEWKEPFEITNAIIDISNTSTYDIKSVFKQLSQLSCKFVQIRFYRESSCKEIISILKYLDKIKSNSIGIDFLILHHNSFKEKDFIALFKTFKRLNSILVYASPLGKKILTMGHSRYYIHTGANIDSEKHCGVINKSLFSINIKTYTEALHFNSCLHGKIAVDSNGEIKNCPSMPTTFGNIANTLLRDALLDKYFKKYWHLNKDKIEVCKDCEFRYICTDCRAYTEDPQNDKSKPLKCGYDPYKGEWHDWSSSELKQEALKYFNI